MFILWPPTVYRTRIKNDWLTIAGEIRLFAKFIIAKSGVSDAFYHVVKKQKLDQRLDYIQKNPVNGHCAK